MSSIDDIIRERKQKIKELEARGILAYPEKCERTHTIGEALLNFDNFVRERAAITLAGRIRSMREHGAIIFFHIEDESGRIQVLLKKENIREQDFELFKKYLDLGDFLEIQGTLFLTNTNEKTLEASSFRLLAKSLRPIPSEWYGLEDTEEKIRKRYLDLLINKEVKKVLDLRIEMTSLVRDFLKDRGFKEVETPILQSVYGGALAEPFITELNSLKMKLYLRIAPELYLKRLIIGGYEKIFEMGKCFRNEGIDKDHNPEFTNLELYQVWACRDDLMKLLEDLIKFLNENLGQRSVLNKENILYPFPKIDYVEFIKNKTGLDYEKDDIKKFMKYAQQQNIEYEKNISKAKLSDLIFKKLRQDIRMPTFIINQLIELSPLAKRDPEDSSRALRFYLIISGKEIANGFSELNDPQEQRKRFEEQEQKQKLGDREAHPLDKDFIEALEYGMPPTAGLGIGMDRLATVIAGVDSIKNVIFFPFLKQK